MKGLTKSDERRPVDEKLVENETLINKNDAHIQKLACEPIKELNGSSGKHREMPVWDRESNLSTNNVEIRNR